MSTCPVPARPGLVRHATDPTGLTVRPARGTGRRARRAAARRSPRLVAASLRRGWITLAVVGGAFVAIDAAVGRDGLGWTVGILLAATAVAGAVTPPERTT